MTEGEKLIWAAAYVAALSGPTDIDPVRAARNAYHAVATLRASFRGLRQHLEKAPFDMVAEMLDVNDV